MFKVAFSVFCNMNQPACSSFQWVLNSLMYKHHWKFPTHTKTIPMLACPVIKTLCNMWLTDPTTWDHFRKYIITRSNAKLFKIGWLFPTPNMFCLCRLWWDIQALFWKFNTSTATVEVLAAVLWSCSFLLSSWIWHNVLHCIYTHLVYVERPMLLPFNSFTNSQSCETL